MKADDLLHHLTSLGIVLTVVRGELRFRAPIGRYTADLRAEVASCRAELLAVLVETISNRPAQEDLRDLLDDLSSRDVLLEPVGNHLRVQGILPVHYALLIREWEQPLLQLLLTAPNAATNPSASRRAWK